MTKHSIIFSAILGPRAQIFEMLRTAILGTNLKPGSHYTLTRWADDNSSNDIVALQEGLPRDRLLEVEESPGSYNNVWFSVWAERVELTLALRFYADRAKLSLIALNDLLEEPGWPWVVSTMGAFLTAFQIEAALLCDQRDESEVERRMRASLPLSTIVLNRVREQDTLPLPLLALVKAELCDGDIWERAAARGIRMSITPKDYVLFSTAS